MLILPVILGVPASIEPIDLASIFRADHTGFGSSVSPKEISLGIWRSRVTSCERPYTLSHGTPTQGHQLVHRLLLRGSGPTPNAAIQQTLRRVQAVLQCHGHVRLGAPTVNQANIVLQHVFG